jgi:hypothetical protein
MARTLTRYRFGVVIVSVTVALALCAAAVAADRPVISVDFHRTPLGEALQVLKQVDPQLSYAVGEEAAERTVTASLVDVPVDHALAVIAESAGLAVTEENGVYLVNVQPGPEIGETYGPPQGTAPTEKPWTTTQPAGSTATTAPASGSVPEDRIATRMIEVQHANPALLAELFGGTAIYGGSGGYGATGSRGGLRGSTDGGYDRGSSGYSDRSRRY